MASLEDWIFPFIASAGLLDPSVQILKQILLKNWGLCIVVSNKLKGLWDANHAVFGPLGPGYGEQLISKAFDVV